MPLSLTVEEKARVRHHMGYLGVDQVQTFVLGVPAAVQTQFVIEGAMNKLLPESLLNLRRLLSILDGVEQQIIEDQELLVASKVDEIEIRPDEFKQLVSQYRYWQNSLGNLLGAYPNPYDQRFLGALGGSINAPVSH